MKKRGMKRKIAAGLAAMAVFGTALELPITMQTAYAAEAGLPSETNNSFAKARDIEFGVSIAGTLSESDGKRYYKFSLDQASKLELGLTIDENRYGMYIKIYDVSRTEIYRCKLGNMDSSFSINEIYLTGGDYYMTFEQYNNTTFSFMANVDSMEESFIETQDSNNDMPSDASIISLKTKYKGVLAQNDDIDYYKFQVPAAGQITLNITNSTSDTVRYGVYDQSMNPSYANTLRQNSKASQPVSVKKGVYYLAIAKEDVNKGTGSYTFTIDHKNKISAAPKLKSVKNSNYGSMSVKWSQVTGASGYELWYSTNSKFKGDVEKKELGASETSASYSGLMQKKYYVKIRAYEEINGVKAYGKWSNKKSVSIKR